jgi:hypothetical protein
MRFRYWTLNSCDRNVENIELTPNSVSGRIPIINGSALALKSAPLHIPEQEYCINDTGLLDSHTENPSVNAVGSAAFETSATSPALRRTPPF